MSRSYKKTPIIKYAPKRGKFGKRMAAQRIRRVHDYIPNGGQYRKYYEAWDIHDVTSRYTLDDAIRWHYKDIADVENGLYTWKSKYMFKNLDEVYNNWAKYYLRK